MTTLKVDVPDELDDRVFAAFAKAYGYSPTIFVLNAKGEEVEIEQTPLAFVESQLATFVKNVAGDFVISTEVEVAKADAVEAIKVEHKDIKSPEAAKAEDDAALAVPAVPVDPIVP